MSFTPQILFRLTELTGNTYNGNRVVSITHMYGADLSRIFMVPECVCGWQIFLILPFKGEAFQELLNQLRTVQIVLRLPSILSTEDTNGQYTVQSINIWTAKKLFCMFGFRSIVKQTNSWNKTITMWLKCRLSASIWGLQPFLYNSPPPILGDNLTGQMNKNWNEVIIFNILLQILCNQWLL